MQPVPWIEGEIDMKCLAVLLGIMVIGVPDATAQQVESTRSSGTAASNRIDEVASGRPRITYGQTRRSTGWAQTPNGTRVAIDDGIRWKETTYYLSLTGQLVAQQDDDQRCDWSHSVSAFWDQMEIADFAIDDGEAQPVLAMRSTQHDDYVEYRSLETGAKVGGTTDQVAGEPLQIDTAWRGASGASDEPWHGLIENADAWTRLHERLFRGAAETPPLELDVDFNSHCLVVIYSGKGSNCRGFSGSLYETDDGWLLRASAHTYQSIGRTPATWPYGVMVVPHREGAILTVERNRQSYIGGPPMWETWHRWEMKGEGTP